jgi:hypothetical protein
VEKFVRLQHDLNENLNHVGESSGPQPEKEGNLEGQSENIQHNRAYSASPMKPSFPYDTCINHIFSHSWSDPIGHWVWVRKGVALETAELELGFPARREEIQRFGYKSSRVIRVKPINIDERSFAEVAVMDPGRGRGQVNRGGAAPRSGGRGGPGRPGEERSYEEFERDSWNREWSSQEAERERPYGFNSNNPSFQGGYRDDRPRYEQQRIYLNKRLYDDRERADWEEQELRAKLKRGLDERRANE